MPFATPSSAMACAEPSVPSAPSVPPTNTRPVDESGRLTDLPSVLMLAPASTLICPVANSQAAPAVRVAPCVTVTVCAPASEYSTETLFGAARKKPPTSSSGAPSASSDAAETETSPATARPAPVMSIVPPEPAASTATSPP